MNDLTRVLEILKSRKMESFAMATVVKIEGSSYRHEGAKMLIDEKGRRYGVISAGCLEEDILHHADEVLQTGKAKLLRYDNQEENDLSWGEWSGCIGVIYVYLEKTGWNFLKDRNGNSLWEMIAGKLSRGQRVISLKYIGEENSETCVFDGDNGNVLAGTDNFIQPSSKELKTFGTGHKQTKMILLENQRTLLMEQFQPKESVYIFGAGPDTELLVELLVKLDFSVTVIDPRSERFEQGNFAAAAQFVIEFPHLYLRHHPIANNSYCLIMTHNFQWDQAILPHLLEHPPKYLGLLGSKKRTEQLFSPGPIPEWVHAPVGLNIMAEGTEEIAISIAAELIETRAKETRGRFSRFPNLFQ
ncbi:XdhC family protein [Bacillus benzoevorans]|uniref:Xanthine dehydrogenase accessory factor n=1 Tax=Bacillus benzoevorans TaxID=1456 RepID=A0A7X0HU10_9BACI|nr:XdhC family protein [Bacillus benzoevorans]MBB6446776.1 xanthine dehydrogenase accessory factor [Bacillus benzoevorans]